MLRTLLSHRWVRQTVNAVKQIVIGLFDHNAFDTAAAMSFYFFLGLIPLLAFAGLVAGELVHDHGIDDIASPFFQIMPKAAAALVEDQLRQIGETPLTSIAPLSLLGFLSVTSNGIHNVMDVFEIVAKAPPRAWWKQRLIALAGVIGLLLALAVAAWVLIFVGNVVDKTGGLNHPKFLDWVVDGFQRIIMGGWNRIGAFSVFAALAAAVLALFYRVSIAHPDHSKRKIWPGTALGIVTWMVISWGFATYVRTMGDYASYYGSLGTVAIFLLWLYLTSLALLIGAELNAHLETRSAANNR